MWPKGSGCKQLYVATPLGIQSGLYESTLTLCKKTTAETRPVGEAALRIQAVSSGRTRWNVTLRRFSTRCVASGARPRREQLARRTEKTGGAALGLSAVRYPPAPLVSATDGFR